VSPQGVARVPTDFYFGFGPVVPQKNCALKKYDWVLEKKQMRSVAVAILF
jgi:hypothetical protein